MNTKNIVKIFVISGFFLSMLFIFVADIKKAEAHGGTGGNSKDEIKSCGGGQVCYSTSGCGNFNIDGHHYGGDQQCAILGKNCPMTPPPPPPVPACSGIGLCVYNGNQPATNKKLGNLNDTTHKQLYTWICPKVANQCVKTIVYGACKNNIDSSKMNFDKKKGIFKPGTIPKMCDSGVFEKIGWNSSGTAYEYNCKGTNSNLEYPISGANPPKIKLDTDVKCSWTPPKKNGICGTANGLDNQKKAPIASKLCTSGSSTSVVDNPDTFDWSCRSSYGGNDVSCSANKNQTVGQCSDLYTIDSQSSKLPTIGLCKKGSVIQTKFDNTTQTWSWVCKGGLGNSGLCQHKKGQDKTSVTEINVTGKMVPSIVNKGQYCALDDLKYTVNQDADSSTVKCNVYRGSEIYADKNVADLGWQVEPGYEYIYKCVDSITGISGQTNPLKCVLNPSVIER